jgi:hypothetical protein
MYRSFCCKEGNKLTEKALTTITTGELVTIENIISGIPITGKRMLSGF